MSLHGPVEPFFFPSLDIVQGKDLASMATPKYPKEWIHHLCLPEEYLRYQELYYGCIWLSVSKGCCREIRQGSFPLIGFGNAQGLPTVRMQTRQCAAPYD